MALNFDYKIVVKKIGLIISTLKWAWDFLLLHSFHSSRVLMEVDCCSWMNECAECAVCLCRIEEGEEIRELKCSHVFHRVCFERWGGYGRWTCPLCRKHIQFDHEDGELMISHQLLVFNFSQIRTTDSDTWWLR